MRSCSSLQRLPSALRMNGAGGTGKAGDGIQNQGTGFGHLGNDYSREGRKWEGNPGALRWSFCEVREPRENNVLGNKFP